MRIAILGATSQIAKDLILSVVQADRKEELMLYARRPSVVTTWLEAVGLANRFKAEDFSEFGNRDYDAIINFVGVGDPKKAAAMGATIFHITAQYDQLALNYLRGHPACRYLFLSSGAVYGSAFAEPVRRKTWAVINLNNLLPQDWYGAAKLIGECRHRGLPDMAIIDIRVFSYFSRTQDLSAGFLLTDIVRSIRDQTVLHAAPDYIVRDVLHPADFHNLIYSLLSSTPTNAAVDCYTRAPIDKPGLLSEMQRQFGLRYEITTAPVAANSTGVKPHYYSLNKRAADFGYAPTRTSMEGIVEETRAILLCH